MTYLVDTDWLVDYLLGDPAAQTLLASLQPSGLAISIITYPEVYEGILRSPNPREREQGFRAFLRGCSVLPVNRTVARRNAAIRLDLRRRGKTIRVRALDLLNSRDSAHLWPDGCYTQYLGLGRAESKRATAIIAV